MLKVGTTFSGIGAVEQALKNLGIPHEVKWACDIDKYAKETYLANHTCEKFYDDIRTIDLETLEYVDLYAFGFPCQDISSMGDMNLDKGRSALVEYSLDIIDKIKPKYFIFENVKMLNSDLFRDFRDEILRRLSENYVFDYNVYNSKYFGVAQSRQRVYCIGARKDVKDFIFSGYHEPIKTKLSDFLDKEVTEAWSRRVWPSVLIRMKETTRYPILDVNGCSKCLITKVHDGGIIKDEIGLRFLTVSERRRLQGFPDNWVMPKSHYQGCKQFGNAMTVPVVQYLIDRLIN